MTSQMEHKYIVLPCRQPFTRQSFAAASCRWICAAAHELKRAASKWRTESFTLNVSDTTAGEMLQCSPSRLVNIVDRGAASSSQLFLALSHEGTTFLALSCQSP